MLLGIISDTHDRLAAIDEALRFFAFKNVDTVVHCGDWKSLSTLIYFIEQAAELQLPVRGVLGNNDLDVDGFKAYMLNAPGDAQVIEGVMSMNLDGLSINMYHGHHAPTLRKVRSMDTADILFLGHTHKPLIERVSKKLIVNPGSTAFAIPRSKQWKPSVALMDVDTMTASIEYLELT